MCNARVVEYLVLFEVAVQATVKFICCLTIWCSQNGLDKQYYCQYYCYQHVWRFLRWPINVMIWLENARLSVALLSLLQYM